MIKDLTLSNADIAKLAGVSLYTVREWRLGRRQPSPETRRRLAKGLTRYVGRLERIIRELEGER